MNKTDFRRVAWGYAMGLGASVIWYGAAYLLGRRYTGVPTNIIWAAAASVFSAFTVRADPVRSTPLVPYLWSAGCLSAGGLLLLGAVALTPFHWDRGASTAWADVAMTTATLVLTSRIRRDFGPAPFAQSATGVLSLRSGTGDASRGPEPPPGPAA